MIDIDLHASVADGQRRFVLDVRFASAATMLAL